MAIGSPLVLMAFSASPFRVRLKIMEIDQDKIKEIAEKYNLEFVVLFGSQATSQTHEKSDVDLAVIARMEFNLLRLSDDFSSLFKRNDVEVVNLATASPVLWRAVARDGKLLYEKNEGFYRRWKVYAWKIWLETARLRRIRDQRLINWAEQKTVFQS